MFTQTLVPLGSLWLTVFVAFVPLVVLLALLAGLRMTAWLATLIAGVVTAAIAIVIWHAPPALVGRAYVYGGLQGVWAVDWITFWGLMIFNTLVSTGDFDRFKRWLVHHATSDIRIQTLMLAWAFGALLEGRRLRISVGGRRADPDRLRHRGPRRDPRRRARQQRARVVRRARRAAHRAGGGHRAAAAGALRLGRPHRRGPRAAAAVGPAVSGERRRRREEKRGRSRSSGRCPTSPASGRSRCSSDRTCRTSPARSCRSGSSLRSRRCGGRKRSAASAAWPSCRAWARNPRLDVAPIDGAGRVPRVDAVYRPRAGRRLVDRPVVAPCRTTAC